MKFSSGNVDHQTSGGQKHKVKWQKAVLATVFIPLVNLLIHFGIFTVVRDASLHPLLITLIAVLWGSVGFYTVYMSLNWMISFYPAKWAERLQPFIFIGPAVLLLGWLLVLPTFRTLGLSLMDASGEQFVGLANYVFAFTDRSMLLAMRNTLLWVVFGTLSCVSLGLLIAILADRSSFERVAKAFIFMPIAISFVGAGIIWRFVYAYRPEGEQQIGVLNALVQLWGVEPQAWTSMVQPWNNFFLIIILTWMMTGFAMVIFSAAIKGVPSEILEAARVDGASEIRSFFSIIIPYIKGTIVAITTAITIFALKVFDIVIVMTGGQYGTEVIATKFYDEYFTFNNTGTGSAIAIVLLLAVLPVIIMNMFKVKREEGF
jgi:alpha-glucoside transport system permease protein